MVFRNLFSTVRQKIELQIYENKLLIISTIIQNNLLKCM
jgi:hypothetical protein